MVDGNLHYYGVTVSKIIGFVAVAIFLYKGSITISKTRNFYLILMYPILFIFFGFFPNMEFSEGWIKSLISAVVGLIIVIILSNKTKQKNIPPVISRIPELLCLMLPLYLVQFFSGSGFLTGRIFKHEFFDGFRISGLMNDPNYFGVILSIGIVLLLFPLVKRTVKLNFLLFATIFLLIIMTGSRSAMLVSFINIIFFIVINEKYSIFKRAFIAFIMAVSIFLAISSNIIPSQISDLFDSDKYSVQSQRTSLVTRMYLLNKGIDKFMENPVLGIGLMKMQEDTSGVYGGNSHNSIVEIMVNNGLIGLILYLGLFWFFTIRAFQISSRNLRFSSIFLLFTIFSLNLFLVNHLLKTTFLVFSIALIIFQYDKRYTCINK